MSTKKDILNLINNFKNETINEELYSKIKSYLIYLNELYIKGTPLIEDYKYDYLLEMFEYICNILNLNFDNILKELNITKKMDNKIILPIQLNSIKKLKYENLNKWLSKYDDSVIITPKLDGISCLYDNVNKKMYTKGNYKYGYPIDKYIIKVCKQEDNSIKLFKHIKKDTKDNIINMVRGELILKKEYFEKYKELYSTARNLVAGVVNNKKKTKFYLDIENLITFVAYEIIDPIYSYKEQLDILYNNGFNVVPYIESDDLTLDRLKEYLKTLDNYIYNCDGLVLRINNEISNNNTKYYPPHIYAFKNDIDMFKTKVINIIWNLSLNNEYIPTLEYETIFYNNKNYKKVSGYNYDIIQKTKANIGNYIFVNIKGDIPTLNIDKTIELNSNLIFNICLPSNSFIENNKLYSNNINLILNKKIFACTKYLKDNGYDNNYTLNKINKILIDNIDINSVINFIVKFNFVKTITFKLLICSLNTNISKKLVEKIEDNINLDNYLTLKNTIINNKIKVAFDNYKSIKNIIDKNIKVIY